MSDHDPLKDWKIPPRTTPSRAELYEAASKLAPEAIRELYRIMKHGDSDSNKVAAAKTLLGKCLPDLKSTDLSDEGAKTLAGLISIIVKPGTGKLAE